MRGKHLSWPKLGDTYMFHSVSVAGQAKKPGEPLYRSALLPSALIEKPVVGSLPESHWN